MLQWYKIINFYSPNINMSKIKLNFLSKSYKIFDDQSLIICHVSSEEYSKFHFQIRFIQKKSQIINLTQFESDLSEHLIKGQFTNLLYLNDDNKLAILQYLKNLGGDPNSTEMIQNKSRYKVKDSTLTKTYDKNLIQLFCLESAPNFNFGYEISQPFSENSSPLVCIQIFSGKQLSKKIYLFPTDLKSLKGAISTLKNSTGHDLENLGCPYVEYLPSKSSTNSNYDTEIQTRINLQSIISEVLIHLEKPKCFRKNGSKKMEIFRNLAKSIANNEELNNISNKLNEHDTWRLLAQHRDPWGFLSFFKGKTYSLVAWQALRDEISSFSNPINTQVMSN